MREPSVTNITVEEFTSTNPVTVGPETPLEEVLRLFREHQFRHLPVTKDKKVLGVISDRDVLWPRPLGAGEHMVARDLMKKNPYSVRRRDPIEDVALVLSQEKLSSAVVVEDSGELYGIFTTTDALNALVELVRSPR